MENVTEIRPQRKIKCELYNDTTEIWKDIAQYEEYYQVSNLGRVRSVERIVHQQGRGKAFDGLRKSYIIKPRVQNGGYLLVWLSKNGKVKAFSVHRLVACAFIAPVDGKNYVNHKDGNKENNCVSNLEWCTKSENQKHAYHVLKRSTNAKPIRCVDTGEVFPSCKEASMITGINVSSINHAVRGLNKHAGGLKWERI